MKTKFFITFVLVIGGCSAESGTPTSIGALENQNHSDTLPGNSKCATNRTQLNVDCLLAVFDEMDFPTLLTTAETSKFYNQLCAISFNRRFSDRHIFIQTYKIPAIFSTSASEMPLRIEDDAMHFKSIHMALKTLRNFGEVIRKLRLNLGNADSVESIAIIRHVDKYCTDSLIELELEVQESYALKHISKPFKKVEHVSFEGDLSSIEQQTIPIHELFPALKSMYLRLWGGEKSYLAYHFPHLEYLRFVLLYGKDVGYVVDLLDKNPQIRHIELKSFKPELLKKVSSMPQLEHFNLTWNGDIETPLTFANVTKFKAGDESRANPVNLSFPRLQELEMYYYRSRYENWLEFLDAHQNLKRFHFHLKHMESPTEEFKELTSMLENLEEMFVYSRADQFIGVNTLIEFIETHMQLKKLHLEQCTDTGKEILQSKFSGEWTITNHTNGLLFERKTIE